MGGLDQKMGRDEDKIIRTVEEKFKALEDGLLSDIRKKQDEILQNQATLSKMYEEAMKLVNAVETANAALEAEVDILKLENEMKESAITNLQWRLAKVEQNSRKKNIEIRGVPVKGGEDLKTVVMSVTNKLGVPLKPEDIKLAHRLKAQPGKIPGIVARLTTKEVVEKILKKKKDIEIKTVEITGPSDPEKIEPDDGKIYVGQNLSPYYRNLLWKSKVAAKMANFQYVWMQGAIMIRKETGAKATKIEHEKDIKFFLIDQNLEDGIEDWVKLTSNPVKPTNIET